MFRRSFRWRRARWRFNGNRSRRRPLLHDSKRHGLMDRRSVTPAEAILFFAVNIGALMTSAMYAVGSHRCIVSPPRARFFSYRRVQQGQVRCRGRVTTRRSSRTSKSGQEDTLRRQRNSALQQRARPTTSKTATLLSNYRREQQLTDKKDTAKSRPVSPPALIVRPKERAPAGLAP